MSSQRPAVAVALAGGASSRMGEDKARLPLPELPGAPWPPGLTLLEWTLHRLAALDLELLLAGGGRCVPPSFERRATAVRDADADGPLGGILGAARARPGHPLLVLGVDLPRIPVALLRALLTEDPGVDWLLPRHARGLEPLCARYEIPALERLEERRRSGRVDLRGLVTEDDLAIGLLEGERLERFGSPKRMFLNLNRPSDFDELD